jgi:PAS domain S-box-containing protein
MQYADSQLGRAQQPPASTHAAIDKTSVLHIRLPLVLIALAALIAFAGFIGWMFGVDRMREPIEGSFSMRLSTSWLLMIISAVISLRVGYPEDRSCQVFADYLATGLAMTSAAIFAFFAAMLTFTNSDLSSYYREDFRDPPSIIAASCFTLLSLSLLPHKLSDVQGNFVKIALTSMSTFIAISAVIGYAAAIPTLYQVADLPGVSVNTAIALSFVSIAALLHVLAPVDWRSIGFSNIPHDRVILFFALISGLTLVEFVWVLHLVAGVARPELELLMAIVFVTSGVWALKQLANRIVERREWKKAQQQIAQHELLFRSIFDSVAVGFAVSDLNLRRVKVNSVLCKMLGRSESELVGSIIWDLTNQEDIQEGCAMIDKLLEGTISSYERKKRMLRKDGSDFWVKTTVSMVRDQNGNPASLISVFEDIQAQVDFAQKQQLLSNEINHRVKNTLAIVQGMARELALQSDSAVEFSAALQDRLQSLARSHDMLIDKNWGWLPLSALLNNKILKVFSPFQDRITCNSDEVILTPQNAITLNLILHELMTNAIKHGSLSTDLGIVRISTQCSTVDGDQWLTLYWNEVGGPIVRPPQRLGFGSFMLDRGVRMGLGGQANLAFDPCGFSCEIKMPLFGK